MDAVKFLKELKRICITVECQAECPFYDAQKDVCGAKIPAYLENDNIENIVSGVEKWSAEHPVKTRLMDFLEKYPAATVREDGLPPFMPAWLGYCGKSCYICERQPTYKDCWNQPLEE